MLNRTSPNAHRSDPLLQNSQPDMRERFQFIGLNDGDLRELQDFWPTLEKTLPQLLKTFVAHAMSVQTAAMHLRGKEDKFCESQTLHWRALFTSGFDAEYFKITEKIGQARYQSGMEPRWFIGSYAKFLNLIGGVAMQAYKRKPKKFPSGFGCSSKSADPGYGRGDVHLLRGGGGRTNGTRA